MDRAAEGDPLGPDAHRASFGALPGGARAPEKDRVAVTNAAAEWAARRSAQTASRTTGTRLRPGSGEGHCSPPRRTYDARSFPRTRKIRRSRAVADRRAGRRIACGESGTQRGPPPSRGGDPPCVARGMGANFRALARRSSTSTNVTPRRSSSSARTVSSRDSRLGGREEVADFEPVGVPHAPEPAHVEVPGLQPTRECRARRVSDPSCLGDRDASVSEQRPPVDAHRLHRGVHPEALRAPRDAGVSGRGRAVLGHQGSPLLVRGGSEALVGAATSAGAALALSVVRPSDTGGLVRRESAIRSKRLNASQLSPTVKFAGQRRIREQGPRSMTRPTRTRRTG